MFWLPALGFDGDLPACPDSAGSRRKVFTLQTLPACDESFDDEVGKVAGLRRASCHPPFGPAFGCSKSLPAISQPACRGGGQGK